ncbi:histone-lysine N-methyltransferase NSD2-like isoform X1 [Trichogramma pretiosum]|uniref:histone-lysine N-methyltransferase NSD2-like isoform X1 n=1 Tax=Trichogramma pretiosum TaxID=7493 RepID=UPI0006C95DB0|nr:histone-lysine N-methyltransferase NSD2-like isoform X1 [Trichogramma pretiosum]
MDVDSEENVQYSKHDKENENTSQDNAEVPSEEVSTSEEECEESLNQSTPNQSMVRNDEPLTSEELINTCKWELNQLAWARMSIYPFWPCMVTHDPNSLLTYKKVSTVGKMKSLMIHVHFFNDHGRHSWIPSHHMIPFLGIEDFRNKANQITNDVRKKEPKFASALTIKPNIFPTWQKAVAEAMDVLYELDLSSTEIFKAKLKDMTNKVSKSDEKTSNKRKRKDESIKSVKKVKVSLSSCDTLDQVDSETNQNDDDESLSLEPKSPLSDDARSENMKKQKRIAKMINKLQPPDFEVYYDRNYFIIKQQNSEATEADIKKYLKNSWDQMSSEEKFKYRAPYKVDK